ncbi:MAG: hypothetical protein ACSLEN_13080 [Candidatus Malihini olakiniferum]
MSIFFAPGALLPQGWARDVRIDVSADGVITDVEQNTTSIAGHVGGVFP